MSLESSALVPQRRGCCFGTETPFCCCKQWWKTQPALQPGLPRQAKPCRAWSWLTVMITSHMSSVHTLTIDLSALPPLPAQHPQSSPFTCIYLTLWSYPRYMNCDTAAGGFRRFFMRSSGGFRMKTVEWCCCRTAYEERCLRGVAFLIQEERETHQILSEFVV